MKIEILDQAEDDLIEGFRFYEAQQPGLGSYFLVIRLSSRSGLDPEAIEIGGRNSRFEILPVACFLNSQFEIRNSKFFQLPVS